MMQVPAARVNTLISIFRTASYLCKTVIHLMRPHQSPEGATAWQRASIRLLTVIMSFLPLTMLSHSANTELTKMPVPLHLQTERQSKHPDLRLRFYLTAVFMRIRNTPLHVPIMRNILNGQTEIRKMRTESDIL